MKSTIFFNIKGETIGSAVVPDELEVARVGPIVYIRRSDGFHETKAPSIFLVMDVKSLI